MRPDRFRPARLLRLALASGIAVAAPSAATAAERPTVYYIVEENGGVTLSNLRRDPMPANAVIVDGGRPDVRDRRSGRPADDSSDIPVLEICTEDGRTTDCDHR